MDIAEILTIVVAILGSGGATALITVLANRKKLQSDTEAVDQETINHSYESLASTAKILLDTAKTLAELYEVRLKNLCERVTALELSVAGRDTTIEAQTKEIAELQITLHTLQLENKRLRTENADLRDRLAGVEVKLANITARQLKEESGDA
jgi:cell division protein FtsB